MTMDKLHEGCSLGELTVRALTRYPDRTAVIFGDRELSYASVRDSVASMAGALKSRGIGPGTGIAILSKNRPEVLFAHCAAYVLGLKYTPLPPMASEDDHAFMLAEAGVACLVVDPEHFRDRGAALAHRVPSVRSVLTFGPADFGTDLLAAAARIGPQPLRSEADAGGVAMLAFTGGTTGRPKAVVQPQRTGVAMHLMMLAQWEWPREVRMLLATPLSHAAGGMVLPTLMRGGTVVIMQGFEPGAFLDEVERCRATVTFLVPTMIYLLLDRALKDERRPRSLETIIYGAAPMSAARLKQGLEVFGPVFMQLYGQTEAPLCLTVLGRDEHRLDRPELLNSCGRPVAGMQLALLDDEGRRVPEGEPGEICVRGPIVMDGYLNRPDETAEALRFGWLHTGDIGRFDAEGYLYIVDRKKDMIISGGFNVYPREIEALLDRHPAVLQSAVVGVPDPKWGEAVTAVVVRRPDQEVTAQQLIEHVKAVQGSVSAPKSVVFVDSLPLTPLGKPDKKAVRAAFARGG